MAVPESVMAVPLLVAAEVKEAAAAQFATSEIVPDTSGVCRKPISERTHDVATLGGRPNNRQKQFYDMDGVNPGAGRTWDPRGRRGARGCRWPAELRRG
jgi:hypothetical protein